MGCPRNGGDCQSVVAVVVVAIVFCVWNKPKVENPIPRLLEFSKCFFLFLFRTFFWLVKKKSILFAPKKVWNWMFRWSAWIFLVSPLETKATKSWVNKSDVFCAIEIQGGNSNSFYFHPENWGMIQFDGSHNIFQQDVNRDLARCDWATFFLLRFCQRSHQCPGNQHEQEPLVLGVFFLKLLYNERYSEFSVTSSRFPRC